MPAVTPDQVHELRTRASTAGDVPALLALYEADAVLAPSPDGRFAGHDAIRAALEGFLALRPSFQVGRARVVQAGDVAVLSSSGQLVGTGRDGSEVRMAGVTSDGMRRQGDGTRLMVIDNPFGGSHVLPEGSTEKR